MEGTVARATAEPLLRSGELLLRLGGEWSLQGKRPAWESVAPEERVARVRVVAEGLRRWDSSLLVFLLRVRGWCEERRIPFEDRGLPEDIHRLLSRIVSRWAPRPGAGPPARARETLRRWSRKLAAEARGGVEFLGETVLGLIGAVRVPRRFRWKDCLAHMRSTGSAALPIVGLISFLVGVIVGFQSAIQLRQFGADIFMVGLVGLSIVREMGPMMAAVVLAGRTGAAFAARIANMVLGEEVDALRTLGISPIDFLVLPRLAALAAMMPLLVLYADFLGILGGQAVASLALDIPPAAYWLEIRRVLTLSDLNVGLIKSVFFALLIGLAGCQRGLRAERSEAGVGDATTSAVVSGTLLVILADALFGKVFETLGM